MMKRLSFALAGFLVMLALVGFGGAFSGSSATAEPAHSAGHDHEPERDFERFLKRYEAANTAFLNGDSSPWRAIAAERDPVSIFGGFGGLGEAGVEAVNQRYLLAAGAFQDSGAEAEFEYRVKDVRGKLAYTVAIERARVLYTGQSEPRDQVLRVTMIFRRERGEWKIVHRHADDMIALELPQ